MPQHVTIELQDATSGTLTTHNLGLGSAYRVTWQGTVIAERLDTGVATQVCATNRRADDHCDFTHARRGIAAAGSAADLVIARLEPDAEPFRGATVVLRTNQIERGRISILPDRGGGLSVEVQIGTSQPKSPDSYPAEVFTLGPYSVRRPPARSRMELIFRVLAAEYGDILRALAAHKLPGTAEP